MRAVLSICVAAGLAISAAACRGDAADAPRASGYVEATEVRVAAEAGGRVLEMMADEGRQVAAGDVLARLDTGDVEIALRRAQADREQAAAQLHLLQAGARREDVRQSQAQADTARSEAAAVEAELKAANDDLQRFEALLAANAGSRKQRDDAAARVSVATARRRAAEDRVRAAEQAVARLQAGARREEIAAAEARVASANAQIASIRKTLGDATVKSPVAGTITAKLVDMGEMVAARTPVAVVSDLDNAWANVYVDEPLVPTLTLGQAATIVTDAGHRIAGRITYISPRAEFTPRNVQTADERSKLVYRIKITVDNREGILKPGMPVEADLGARPPQS
jgi:HlyD family secretion protein